METGEALRFSPQHNLGSRGEAALLGELPDVSDWKADDAWRMGRSGGLNCPSQSAIGRAILGVVVGEFFGSSQGLGYMIASAATNYKVDVVFVGVAIFMALSVILTLAVKQLESHLASWRPETAKTF